MQFSCDVDYFSAKLQKKIGTVNPIPRFFRIFALSDVKYYVLAKKTK